MAAPIGKHAVALNRCCFLLSRVNNIKIHQQVRHGRKARRTPFQVLSSEEADILHQQARAGKAKGQAPRAGSVKLKDDPKQSMFASPAYLKGRQQQNDLGRFSLPENVRYEKLLEGDHRFGRVVMHAKSRNMREKKEIILLEGNRLIMDAAEAGAKFKSLFFTKVEHLEGLPLEEMAADLYKVQMSHLRLWSDVNTPPGVMAICKRPKPGELVQNKEETLPLTLLFDNVRDPGNMGTLLRSAAAAGCRKVLLMKGCVDPWEPKVLRAGAGSHFRLHILSRLGWELVGNYLTDESQVFLADCSGHVSTKPRRAPRWLLEKISAVEPNKYLEKNEETEEVLEIDETFLDRATVELYKRFPLSTQPYTEVDFSGGEPVIIIGGETEGVSAGAYKLAYDRNGDRIFIPMMPGVDSLNSAVAGTVLLFEARKQLLQSAVAKERTSSSKSEDKDCL